MRWVLPILVLAGLAYSAYYFKQVSLQTDDPLARAEKMVQDQKKNTEDCWELQEREHKAAEELVRRNVYIPAGCEGPLWNRFKFDAKLCGRLKSEATSGQKRAEQENREYIPVFQRFVEIAKQYAENYYKADVVFLAEAAKPGRYRIMKVYKGDHPRFDPKAENLNLTPINAAYEPYYIKGYASAEIRQEALVFAMWNEEHGRWVSAENHSLRMDTLGGTTFFWSEKNPDANENTDKSKAWAVGNLEEFVSVAGKGVVRVRNLEGQTIFELSYKNHELNGISRQFDLRNNATQEILFQDGEFKEGKLFKESETTPSVHCRSILGEVRCDYAGKPSAGGSAPEKIRFSDGGTLTINRQQANRIYVYYGKNGRSIYTETWFCDQ